jgi:hypothetical protein
MSKKQKKVQQEARDRIFAALRIDSAIRDAVEHALVVWAVQHGVRLKDLTLSRTLVGGEVRKDSDALADKAVKAILREVKRNS